MVSHPVYAIWFALTGFGAGEETYSSSSHFVPQSVRSTSPSSPRSSTCCVSMRTVQVKLDVRHNVLLRATRPSPKLSGSDSKWKTSSKYAGSRLRRLTCPCSYL